MEKEEVFNMIENKIALVEKLSKECGKEMQLGMLLFLELGSYKLDEEDNKRVDKLTKEFIQAVEL